MHKTTGIAGYTLIYNSHGLRLKAHQPFQGVEAALSGNVDIESDLRLVEKNENRILVANSDNGEKIKEQIADLRELLGVFHECISD